MREDIEKVLFSTDAIAERLAALGHEITKDYEQKCDAGSGLVVICILRGSVIFTADLVRNIDLPLELDFMSVSSYGNGTKSSGNVRVEKDLGIDIEGKDVIIVEDIIDSGLTISFLSEELQKRNPASIACAAMLYKEGSPCERSGIKYIGFDCPDEFIVGYGLDYAQQYRNLPDICVLKPAVYE